MSQNLQPFATKLLAQPENGLFTDLGALVNCLFVLINHSETPF